jgi:hypothetical protein
MTYFLIGAILAVIPAVMAWREREPTGWCIGIFIVVTIYYPLILRVLVVDALGNLITFIDKMRGL